MSAVTARTTRRRATVALVVSATAVGLLATPAAALDRDTGTVTYAADGSTAGLAEGDDTASVAALDAGSVAGLLSGVAASLLLGVAMVVGSRAPRRIED